MPGLPPTCEMREQPTMCVKRLSSTKSRKLDRGGRGRLRGSLSIVPRTVSRPFRAGPRGAFRPPHLALMTAAKVLHGGGQKTLTIYRQGQKNVDNLTLPDYCFAHSRGE